MTINNNNLQKILRQYKKITNFQNQLNDDYSDLKLNVFTEIFEQMKELSENTQMIKMTDAYYPHDPAKIERTTTGFIIYFKGKILAKNITIKLIDCHKIKKLEVEDWLNKSMKYELQATKKRVQVLKNLNEEEKNEANERKFRSIESISFS